MPPIKKRSLTRDKIINQAIKLADQKGLDELSMRKLASALNVKAMSLYNHIDHRADLISAMTNELFRAIHWDDSLEWKKAMRDRATATKKIYNHHPWMVAVANANQNPGPDILASHERVLKCLVHAGFGLRLAAHALSILDAYTAGFFITEQSLPTDTDLELQELAQAILSSIPTQKYPYLHQLTKQHILSPDYSYSKEFMFGLDLILDQLETLLSEYMI